MASETVTRAVRTAATSSLASSAMPLTATVGAVASILMVSVSIAEAVPAASVARAWTRVTPSLVTWNGAVYAVQAPLPMRYSRPSFPSPPAPARETVTGEVNQLSRPLAAAGAVVMADGGLRRLDGLARLADR